MDFKQGKSTIDEVANKAGVSKTTISRYINGRYEYMSEETRKRIQSIIEELDYRPSNIARSLKSNKSGLIGMLIADITSPFSSILVKGIGDVCKEKGYQVVIANADNDSLKEREYIQSFMDNSIEGLIIHATGENSEFLVELGEQGLPIVLVDRPMDKLKLDTVMSNNYDITSHTIKYMIETGYKQIAFFTEEIGHINSRQVRKKAFLSTCKDYLGVDAEDLVYVINADDEENIQSHLKEFMNKESPGPKAIFAVNGVTLLSVLLAINNFKLKIPEDLGICGYDDWGWAALIPPGITVISQPSYEIGTEAAKRLISRISSSKKVKPKLLELPAELIIRGSTKLE